MLLLIDFKIFNLQIRTIVYLTDKGCVTVYGTLMKNSQNTMQITFGDELKGEHLQDLLDQIMIILQLKLPKMVWI